MTGHTQRRIGPLLAIALLFSAACETPTEGPPGLAVESPGAHTTEAGPWLNVATWNVYLGGDIAPVLGADFGNPLEVVAAAATAWNQVQNSNLPERAAAVVGRLAEEMPAVVGLQEVFRFIELDGAFQPIAAPLDMLELIEDEISTRGLPYQVLGMQEATSAALPVRLDFNTFQVDRWVAFTDRVVTLARNDVAVSQVMQGAYQASFPLAPAIELKRGWIRVDVEHWGGTVHLINTHLEGQSLSPIQSLQVDELLGPITSGLPGTVVIMGDLNSDAAASPGAPSWTPTYGRIVDAGFFDVWTEVRPKAGQGFTCCHDPGLSGPEGNLDERIDFVLVRQAGGAGGQHLEGKVRADLLGHEHSEQTDPSGLWPSDHAGIAVELLLPPGLASTSQVSGS